MNNTNSLWPADLDETLADRRSAQVILEEQADLLPIATAGDVTASVSVVSNYEGPESTGGKRLNLNLGSRDGYTQELLSIYIDIALPYPCDVVFENEIQMCANPAQLVSALGEVLQSESTKSLLLALAVRSNEASAK